VLSVALAALSGLIWGVGDFSGGKATQRAAVLPVVWVSKLVSLPLLAIYLVATYVPVTPIGLAWGGLAGIAGVVGLVLFYRALSAGAMTVVAPVTGVTSAAIPVVVGLVAGERPSPLRLLGVGCALVAIALVSLAPHPAGRRQVVSRRLVAAALGAGTSFALFFILLAVAGKAAGSSVGLWPIAGSQLSSVVILALLLMMTRPGPWPHQATLGWTIVAGPCDMTANVRGEFLRLLRVSGGLRDFAEEQKGFWMERADVESRDNFVPGQHEFTLTEQFARFAEVADPRDRRQDNRLR